MRASLICLACLLPLAVAGCHSGTGGSGIGSQNVAVAAAPAAAPVAAAPAAAAAAPAIASAAAAAAPAPAATAPPGPTGPKLMKFTKPSRLSIDQSRPLPTSAPSKMINQLPKVKHTEPFRPVSPPNRNPAGGQGAP